MCSIFTWLYEWQNTCFSLVRRKRYNSKAIFSHIWNVCHLHLFFIWDCEQSLFCSKIRTEISVTASLTYERWVEKLWVVRALEDKRKESFRLSSDAHVTYGSRLRISRSRARSCCFAFFLPFFEQKWDCSQSIFDIYYWSDDHQLSWIIVNVMNSKFWWTWIQNAQPTFDIFGCLYMILACMDIFLSLLRYLVPVIICDLSLHVQ